MMIDIEKSVEKKEEKEVYEMERRREDRE